MKIGSGYLRFVPVLLVLLGLPGSTAAEDIGATFLLIWPTPRSAALAGAMTALADEADASFWNPAGLGLQTGFRGVLSYGNLLPGLYDKEHYSQASANWGFPDLMGSGANLGLGACATHLDEGKSDLIDSNGNHAGTIRAWRGTAGLQAGLSLSKHLSVGLGLKVIHISYDERGWFEEDPPPTSGTSLAADLGVSYRPARTLSLGLAAVNLGPNIGFRGIYHGFYGSRYFGGYALPRMLRFGACYSPGGSRIIRASVMFEADKLLVSDDSTPGDWLSNTSRSLACEVSAFEILSLRLGYYENPGWSLGGVVVETGPYSWTEHLSLVDALFGKRQGKFKSLGLCYGFGLGYKDLIRFDVSNDALIYDFPTSNWKLALITNDAVGLYRTVVGRAKSGHSR